MGVGMMRISELAARSGVPASTLRFYESEGLLPAGRSGNGYRRYDASALDRLAFITQAKQLDLSLASVRQLVTAWEAEPCASVRAKYRPLLQDHAGEIRRRVAALTELDGKLSEALARLDALPDRPERCDPSCAFLDRDRPPLPVVLSSPTPAIACSLDADAHADRVAEWHFLLSRADRTDIEGGARFTLPIADLDRATRLAVAEQSCCSFYAISFALRSGWFELTITAPAEAAEMLADLLPNQQTLNRPLMQLRRVPPG